MDDTKTSFTWSNYVNEDTIDDLNGPTPTPAERSYTYILSILRKENQHYFNQYIDRCQLTVSDILNFIEFNINKKKRF